jgi:hypothetical protein
MYIEENSCPFRLLVAGSGHREVRMLELAPVPKEIATEIIVSNRLRDSFQQVKNQLTGDTD